MAGVDVERVLETVSPRVTNQMNALLTAEYTEDEIKRALDDMGDLKAPGADGMPAIFYKRFWGTVGDTVVKEVLHVLRGGSIPEGWNETIAVLIPKVRNPDRLKDLRPISLCNVVYKLISKVIANRLKIILGEIVSPNQSAFVPGRLISDNTILAYEMSHFMRRKRKGKDVYMALKLDMSKAYDIVEWPFLEGMLRKMGFDESFTKLIMECVTTVSYRFRVNGDLTEVVHPGRGLQQGDPISPYLFLLCAEGFSALLQKAENDGLIRGIKLASAAPRINHLLFADDSLILMEANVQSVETIKSILQIYEEGSGQMINRDKSSVMFSSNAKRYAKNLLLQCLELGSETTEGKYLGLPTYIGRSRKKCFAYIKEKIWKRIQGWKEKLMSMAAKEILIKAVAQAIPTYAMACFDLTKSLCDEIGQLVCRYWWSQNDEMRRMHWVGWETMKLPKEEGGLGFRDLYSFNLAMLARQSWRLLQAPDSLCAQVLRAKYFPDGNLLSARPVVGMSYVWRSILKGLEVLKEGIIWRIGDGLNVNIWEDPWMPTGVTRRPTTHKGNCELNLVAELIDDNTGDWNKELIMQHFLPADVQTILSIPLRENTDDFMAWHFDARGVFSVKSAYKVHVDMDRRESVIQVGQGSAHESIQQEVFWKIWKVQCPPKIHHFLWRFAHNSHPLYMNIARRGVDLDTRCAMCHAYFEDGGHLFLNCKYSKQRWRGLGLEDVRLKLLPCQSAVEVLQEILELPSDHQLLSIAFLWICWTERNRGNHGELRQSIDQCIFSARHHVDEWTHYLKKKTNATVPIVSRWAGPPMEFVKINIDASFKEVSGVVVGEQFVVMNLHRFNLLLPVHFLTSLMPCMLKQWPCQMLSS
jgi:hypothetical protein